MRVCLTAHRRCPPRRAVLTADTSVQCCVTCWTHRRRVLRPADTKRTRTRSLSSQSGSARTPRRCSAWAMPASCSDLIISKRHSIWPAGDAVTPSASQRKRPAAAHCPPAGAPGSVPSSKGHTGSTQACAQQHNGGIAHGKQTGARLRTHHQQTGCAAATRTPLSTQGPHASRDTKAQGTECRLRAGKQHSFGATERQCLSEPVSE